MIYKLENEDYMMVFQVVQKQVVRNVYFMGNKIVIELVLYYWYIVVKKQNIEQVVHYQIDFE